MRDSVRRRCKATQISGKIVSKSQILTWCEDLPLKMSCLIGFVLGKVVLNAKLNRNFLVCWKFSFEKARKKSKN